MLQLLMLCIASLSFIIIITVGDKLPRGSIAIPYNNIREKNSRISLAESNAILRKAS